MIVARNLEELRDACSRVRARFGSVALVPTMGALHAGHGRLVESAVAAGAGVVTSVFVNPTQFAVAADAARYPRDEAGDLAALERFGCAVAWLPGVAVMYPPGDATVVEVAGPALRWEGAARPGHFRGVATVCARLFGQVRPDMAFFGEKDWQQLQVIRRMVADLLLPLEIVGVETVREADGLAMSSRNRFLSADERAVAPVLAAALRRAVAALEAGGDVGGVLAAARDGLAEAGFVPEYVELVEASGLEPLHRLVGVARLIATARLGSVRLLDNMAVGLGNGGRDRD